MSVTNKAPNVPLDHLKRTKIIATVGPSSNNYKVIYEMIMAGVNGIRLNYSHGTDDERKQQIEWVRRASSACGKPIAIIQDLQGPKIRLGEFEGIINVRANQTLQLKYKADYKRSGIIPTQYDLSKKVKRGEPILLSDGKIHTVVSSVKDGIVYIKVENEGILLKNKGINLPDTDFSGDIITNKDKKDIVSGVELGVDYVALSFVQNGSDIVQLKRILKNLGSKAKIIAKIETKAAIDNIESIFEQADVVMVARGDLAVETPPESVPVNQRNIIAAGLKHKKPTIVATQMLASMTEALEPTRAEVSDIATAVIVGADCVMLSDETASGRYPIESVEVMKRVILYTQDNSKVTANFSNIQELTKQNAISQAIIKLAEDVGATAIVAETKSGATAQQIASYRPTIPIIAVTSDENITRQLAILYGTISYTRPADRLAAVKMTNWLKLKRVLKAGDVIITASGQYPGVVGTTDTIKVRVL